MTVADLQKYFRALAEVMGAGRGPAAKDLADAADRLGPFAASSVAEFAALLELAREYRDTGRLTPPTAPLPSPKPQQKDPAGLTRLVRGHYARANDPSLTREQVERDINGHDKLTVAALTGVAKELGILDVPKKKPEILRALVRYVMDRKGAAVRADA
jgi:hypothetical protein